MLRNRSKRKNKTSFALYLSRPRLQIASESRLSFWHRGPEMPWPYPCGRATNWYGTGARCLLLSEPRSPGSVAGATEGFYADAKLVEVSSS